MGRPDETRRRSGAARLDTQQPLEQRAASAGSSRARSPRPAGQRARRPGGEREVDRGRVGAGTTQETPSSPRLRTGSGTTATPSPAAEDHARVVVPDTSSGSTSHVRHASDPLVIEDRCPEGA